MLDPEIIEALNAIVSKNDSEANLTPGKVEVVNTYSPLKEAVLKIKLNGDLSEVFAHASHSSHRSHNSHRSHHSHRSSLV